MFDLIRFQSTLPMRGATDRLSVLFLVLLISIHAPHAGSDSCDNSFAVIFTDFNPRSPCGERPAAGVCPGTLHPDFNPRSPCGERRALVFEFLQLADFNPRSPCGERRLLFPLVLAPYHFNPRSPCGERLCHACHNKQHPEFQSTLPMRGATDQLLIKTKQEQNFNPRSPCGERPMHCGIHLQPRHFNPRSPCGERQRKLPTINAIVDSFQ